VIAISSVRIVDAGYRGVLVQFGNVDTSKSLDEGLHFVIPFRDNVVQMEVRSQKIVESTTSASKDLQDVSTQVALNYHLNPDKAQVAYQQLGFDYANRVIIPAIQESVKLVTARFNAEELITKRETVKEGGQGVTPFIEIPTSRSESVGDTQTSIGNITTSSSDLPSSTMNRFNPTTQQH
jgi:prohibitin 2